MSGVGLRERPRHLERHQARADHQLARVDDVVAEVPGQVFDRVEHPLLPLDAIEASFSNCGRSELVPTMHFLSRFEHSDTSICQYCGFGTSSVYGVSSLSHVHYQMNNQRTRSASAAQRISVFAAAESERRAGGALLGPSFARPPAGSATYPGGRGSGSVPALARRVALDEGLRVSYSAPKMAGDGEQWAEPVPSGLSGVACLPYDVRWRWRCDRTRNG